MSEGHASPLAPLRRAAFRILWTTAIIANVCMWMSDVSAAWTMTSLTSDPRLVALVQTASLLPVFLLGLPSGALADGVDRKKFLLATQIWVAGTAALLGLCAFAGWMTPSVLLVLVFANGVGLAMRMPVLAAAIPEVVPREEVPAGMALSAVAMNTSRIIGPIAAGALIASAGTAWVFLINALLSAMAALVITRWRRNVTPDPLGRERLLTAMRVGLQYVAQSRHIKGVLVRLGIFFFCSAALLALLPLVARGLKDGGATAYTTLIAAMGAGAIASSWLLPRLRGRYSRDALVLRGCIVLGLAMAGTAVTESLWQALPLLFVAGAAWITTGNTLAVSSQLGLPDWVRARGMSISQMTVMGASAIGAALWGQVAAWMDVSASQIIAAVLVVCAMALVNRCWPDSGTMDDVTPTRVEPIGLDHVPPDDLRVMVALEYRIDPARAEEFSALMWKESRPSRLRNGALSWDLLHDLDEPDRFVEVVIDESWSDHLRRFYRMTSGDVQLRERKRSFMRDGEEPRITRYLIQDGTQEKGFRFF